MCKNFSIVVCASTTFCGLNFVEMEFSDGQAVIGRLGRHIKRPAVCADLHTIYTIAMCNNWRCNSLIDVD